MDFCVKCGQDLPTENGSQVCRDCELTAGISFMKFNCPECGEKLQIYYKHVVEHRDAWWDSFPCTIVDLIYHCDKCGCDWDSKYTGSWGDSGQTALKRHYWG
jgi:predicted RNA-binding Zn-ribbon protein involved in translation (DUF1610 family)